MAKRPMAPVYADRVVAARHAGDVVRERNARRELQIACQRSGVSVPASLRDAQNRAVFAGK